MDNLENKITNMIMYYKGLCEKDPHNLKAVIDFGIFYTQLGKHIEAIEMFKKALTLNSNDYSIWRLIGISYTKIKNYYNAVMYLEKAYQLYRNRQI